MNKIMPVGCGYDYFATTTSFLARLKHLPILDVTDKLSISNESDTNIIIDTKESISDLFTPYNIQDDKNGQYRLSTVYTSAAFKLMNKYVETPIYKIENSLSEDVKSDEKLVGSKRIESTDAQYVYTHLVIVNKKSQYTFTGNIMESLNSDFVLDLQGGGNESENITLLTPQELRNKYGTHVITSAILGGLVELFIVTEKRNDESCVDIEREIEAAFRIFVMSDGNPDQSEAIKNVFSRSTFTCKIVGGKTLPMFDVTDFITNYSEWYASLNNSNNQEFCGIYDDDFKASCISIFNLSSSPSRKLELQNQFDNEFKNTNFIYGPALQSHLSEPIYRKNNNDMVIALTQYSINQTLKSYIKKDFQVGKVKSSKVSAFILQYVVTGKGKKQKTQFYLFQHTDVEKELPESFPQELRCKDLFNQIMALGLDRITSDVTQQTEDEKKKIQEAEEKYCLSCAIYVEFGFPKLFTAKDIAEFQPISLNTHQPEKVRYTQCFKEFKVMEFDDGILNVYDQNEDIESCMFVYDISLKLTEGDKLIEESDKTIGQSILHYLKLMDLDKSVEDLEETTLNNLYNKVDDMYSIFKLYLDFDSITIVPIDFEDYRQFQFANNIIPEILKHNLQDEIVLTRSITENKQKDEQYLMLPLDYKFTVTPGPNSDDDLNTLDYVVNLGGDCNDNPLVPQVYNWNWIGEGRKHMQAGVSVINRQAIFDEVLTLFNKNVVQKLCLQPKVSIEGNFVQDVQLIPSLTSVTVPSSMYFKFNNNEQKYIYGKDVTNEWGWTCHDNKNKAIFIPPTLSVTCGLQLQYYMSANASWSSIIVDGKSVPAIILEMNVKTSTDVTWNSEHNIGDVYHHLIRCIIALCFDKYGNFGVLPITENIELPIKLDKNFNSQVCPGINSVCERISNLSEKVVDEALNNYNEIFTQISNIGAGWLLPGCGKFLFSNGRFTKDGDLAIDICHYLDEQNIIE